MMRYSGFSAALGCGVLFGIPGCSDPGASRNIETALVDLSLRSVAPDTVLPGSVLVIEGDAFVDDPWGKSRLRLEGKIEGPNGPEKLEVRSAEETLDRLQGGELHDLRLGLLHGRVPAAPTTRPGGSPASSTRWSATPGLRREAGSAQ